jgi:hypothetical protein
VNSDVMKEGVSRLPRRSGSEISSDFEATSP